MTANLLANGEQQFLDLGGNPLSGGLVYMYMPFTTTPSATWIDPDQTTPNTNPIILDSAGRAIIWGVGLYRQVVTDSSGNLIWDQLTSDSGLSGLQSQINVINNQLTVINGRLATLDSEVSALQAIGLKVDYITVTQSYTLKATAVEIVAVGGGGGGSGTNGGLVHCNGGGAGGGGFDSLTGLTIGNTISITVGEPGPGGGTGAGSGGNGGATILASGTQSIPTKTAGGGHGGNFGGSAGIGGTSTGFMINNQGNGGGDGVGGVSNSLSPYGDGGSPALDGTIINGEAIFASYGAKGMVLIRGVW